MFVIVYCKQYLHCVVVYSKQCFFLQKTFMSLFTVYNKSSHVIHVFCILVFILQQICITFHNDRPEPMTPSVSLHTMLFPLFSSPRLGTAGPQLNDQWERYMVDRVHGLTLEEEVPVIAEFRLIHGAVCPVTVSRSGKRWDGYERDELVLGDLEVECSIPNTYRAKKVSVHFDPESSHAYLDYKAIISEMSGLVYKWPQLHKGFMNGMAGLMKCAFETIGTLTNPKLDVGKSSSCSVTPETTYVSSNIGNLNHKDNVRRHGY